jgi:hypothetical protein
MLVLFRATNDAEPYVDSNPPDIVVYGKTIWIPEFQSRPKYMYVIRRIVSTP